MLSAAKCSVRNCSCFCQRNVFAGFIGLSVPYRCPQSKQRGRGGKLRFQEVERFRVVNIDVAVGGLFVFR